MSFPKESAASMTEFTTTQPGLRVLVIGTSGSGKSTFAEKLAGEAGIAHLELDLINWRPGWYNRSAEEPEAFIADVDQATSQRDWVLAGNYSVTRPVVLPRVTHLVWMDLPLWLVMAQVIPRSIRRAAAKDRDVFDGCREDWPRLIRADHPIRWALTTHYSRRHKYVAAAEKITAQGGQVLRCTTRYEIDQARQSLVALTRVRSAA
jgi:adenylate kinase family enzyme